MLAPHNSLLAHARRLAQTFDYGLEVAEDIPAVALERLRCGSSDLIVVQTAELISDKWLQRMLAVQSEFVASTRSWNNLPLFSLITGHDADGVARLIEKACTAIGASRERWTHLRYAHGEAGRLRIVDLGICDRTGEETIERIDLTGDAVEAELRRSAALLVIDTHGTESCGKVDGRVVLCGREPEMLGGQSGRLLACGHGHACPKGERPFALRQLSSRVISIASCGSLRLGDSPLQPGFNFALSALQGSAEAYVGTILPSGGNRLGSIALLAAFASGRSLGEATLLMNALVEAARLDCANRVCVGATDLQLFPTWSEPVLTCDVAADRSDRSFAFGKARFAVIQIIDPDIVELARERSLAVEIATAAGTEPTFYFYRLEQDEDIASLRLFLFRFPESLGDLCLRFIDARNAEATARAADDRLRKWWRLNLLAKADESSTDDVDELPAFREAANRGTEAALSAMPYDGGATIRLRRVIEMLASTGDLLRSETRELVVGKLARAFWLPNLFAPVQRLQSSQPTDCRYCGGLAMCSLFEDDVNLGAREVEVCAQCSILSDLPQGGQVRSVNIECLRDAPLRRALEVFIRLEGDAMLPDSEIEIFARLTTPNFGVVEPRLDGQTVKLRRGQVSRLAICFDLPDKLVPHYYFVKLLLCSRDSLGFASRRLFLS